MADPEELTVAFQQAAEDYVRFIEAQPEAAFHHRPAPEEWSAAEITGHMAEFPLFISRQALRLSQQPGLQLGRPPEDAARMEAVRRMAGATPAEGAAAVRRAVQEAVATLRQIHSQGWQSQGKHRSYGDFTATDIVERLLVAHCRAHLHQAQAAIEAARG